LVKSAAPGAYARNSEAQDKPINRTGDPANLCHDASMRIPMKHFLLFYSFTEGYLERRAPYRNLHLKYAWDAQRRGELVLAGALTDPADAGVLLFKAASPDTVSEFARHDPYVINGLVTSFRVREWTTVVGTDATMPVRPEALANSEPS
jgi:uncharacterized protein YciI